MLLLRAFRYARFKCQCWSTIVLRPLLIRLSFFKARLLALSRRQPDGKCALLLPTCDPGNLGDEAFFFGAVQELRQMGYQRVCVISFHREKMWKVPGAETIVLALHHNPAGSEYIRFVDFASRFTHFFIWGADILDGSQGLRTAIPRFRLANLASTLGLKTSICSFSLNASPDLRLLAGFGKTRPEVRLFCRDEVSLGRITPYVSNGRAQLSADLAFLLEPDHDRPLSREVRAWVERRRQAGDLVLGLNINDAFCWFFKDATPKTLVGWYVQLYLKLREQLPQLALVHLPHNLHATPPSHGTDDFQLAAQFEEQLPLELRGQNFCLRRTVRATEIRAICRYVDLVFSGRMHLSIAALAVGTPVLGVAYQGKFEGLFRHFGLENTLLTQEQLRDSEVAARFLVANIQRLPKLRQAIADRLPHVKELARRNLKLE